jgi:hypothetical protein
MHWIYVAYVYLAIGLLLGVCMCDGSPRQRVTQVVVSALLWPLPVYLGARAAFIITKEMHDE